MCQVCTEAVHSVALWTRTLSQVWTCVKYVPKPEEKTVYFSTPLTATGAKTTLNSPEKNRGDSSKMDVLHTSWFALAGGLLPLAAIQVKTSFCQQLFHTLLWATSVYTRWTMIKICHSFMPVKLAHLLKHLHAATALVRAFNLPVSLETFNHFFGLEITTMVNFTTWVVKPLVTLAVMARPKNGLQQPINWTPTQKNTAKTHPTGDPPVRRVPPSHKKNVSTEKIKINYLFDAEKIRKKNQKKRQKQTGRRLWMAGNFFFRKTWVR